MFFMCCDPVYSVSLAEFLCSHLLNHQCFISTFHKAAKVSDAGTGKDHTDCLD